MLHGSYDYRLVALSIVLAIFAAYAALDLAGRVTAARGWPRALWLAGGATSMGTGIWAMHYIGMLAFSLPVPVLYHYPTVILSLLAAVAASAVALFTASRERMSVVASVAGSLMIGGGIAAMHYTGMAAMRLPAMMEYRRALVALSLLLAVAISLAALILAFQARQEKKASVRKVLSAFVMGSAIPLMHYTGMWAVQFRASEVPFSSDHAVRISSLGILVIALTSFLVMATGSATAFLDRLLAMKAAVTNAARDGESRFRILAEAIPQIVWTAGPDGAVDYCNSRWQELTGLAAEEGMAESWHKVLHADDLPVVLSKWEKSLRTGTGFEMEYRIRDREGQYRWHLVRATPMKDSTGAIVKWFGACADIDDQMNTQQHLEEQIKQHTTALIEANARLKAEMHERSLAQQELNQQNERMVRELTMRSNRATTLAKMAELLQSCDSLKDVFSVVSGMAPKMFPALRGAVLLLDPSRKFLEVVGSWGSCELPAAFFEPHDCWALRTGHLHAVTPGDHTAECRHAASGKYSYFCLPLISQGEAAGILHFQWTQAGSVPESDLSLACTFGEQVGLSVANIRLREALRSQSIRDPLTGLYNRRYLEETLEREIRRAVRAEQSLGILLLDLDHFKKFNDTYGHDAGDTVLRETASFLARSIRAEDIVCRFGGEEFVIILPTAELGAAHGRAERIRSRMRDLSVRHQGQPLGMITVSIGVAALPLHGTSPKELLEAADSALYCAKREGRDQVRDAAEPVGEVQAPIQLTRA